MKTVYSVCLTGILAIFVFSCSDVYEKNLTNKQVSLLAPADSAEFSTNNVTFWWQTYTGATKYELEVVEGSFANPLKLVTDTNVSSNQFTYSLYPGNFQWRVRPENDGSKGQYMARTLIIDSTDLSNLKVVLSTPADKANYFGGSIYFSWNSLYGASYYIIEIDTTTGNYTAGKLLMQDTVTDNSGGSTVTQYEQLTPTGGKFKWRVRASNGKSFSQYSDENSFTINKTAPVLTIPVNQATGQSNPASLQWNTLSGAQSYMVFVKDTATKDFATGYPISDIKTTSQSFTAGSSKKTYSWAVSAVDASNNISDTSAYRTFTLQ